MMLKKNYAIYLVIFVLLVAPWFNSSSDQIDYIPELRQEANPFYEINPCKISLFEFFNANRKSLYQDHYFLDQIITHQLVVLAKLQVLLYNKIIYKHSFLSQLVQIL